jgi:hypothetical protein
MSDRFHCESGVADIIMCGEGQLPMLGTAGSNLVRAVPGLRQICKVSPR